MDDYGDLRRLELMRRAQIARKRGFDVWFKYTCAGCAARLCLPEPNTSANTSVSEESGHETRVRRGGFALVKAAPTLSDLEWLGSRDPFAG